MRHNTLLIGLCLCILAGCGGNGSGNPASKVQGIFYKSYKMVADPVSGKLWVSTPGTAGVHGNKLAQFDPVAKEIVQEITVGSEPSDFALSSDGQTAWLSLRGQASIQRVNLVTGVADTPISLGTDPDFGLRYPEMIQVIPGPPNSVVVQRNADQERDVAAIDSGVARATTSNRPSGLVVLRYAVDSPDLFGLDDFSGFYHLTVDGGGVTSTQIASNAYMGDFTVAGSKVFGCDGRIRDAATGNVIYDLNIGNQSTAVLAVPSRNRLYFIAGDQFGVFDLTNYALIQVIPVHPGQYFDLVPFGAHGVAFRDSSRLLFIADTQ